MVKLPGFDNRRSIETGSQFLRTMGAADDTGRALTRLGSTLGAAGARVAAVNEQLENKVEQDKKRADTLDAEATLIKWETQQRTRLKDSSENVTGSAQGFYNNFMTETDKSWQDLLTKMPDTVRGEYEVKFLRARESLGVAAAGVETGARRKFLVDTMTAKRENVVAGLKTGLIAPTDARADVDSFAASLGFDEPKTAMIRRELHLAIDGAIIEREVRERPDAVLRELRRVTAPASSAPRLPQHETIIAAAERVGVRPEFLLMAAMAEDDKFRSDYKNPKSSAYGMFGFTDELWKDLGVARTADPEIQSRLAAMLYKKNIQRLDAEGISITAGSFWGMHFLGPAGYLAVVKAAQQDPNTSFLDVYRRFGDKKAMDAQANNGELLKAGSTVGQVLERIESYAQRRLERVMPLVDGKGGPPAAGPIVIGGETLTALTPADLPKFYALAQAEIQKRGDQEFKDFLKRDAGSPRTDFNPFSSADRKMMDEAAGENTDRLTRFAANDPAAFGEIKADIARLRYLPKPYAEIASNMISSVDPARKLTGYKLLAETETINPLGGLEHSSIPPDIKARVKDYMSLVSERGLAPEVAMARAEKMHTPDYKKSVAVDATRLKYDADGLRISDISVFNESGPPTFLNWVSRGYISASTSSVAVSDRVKQQLLSQFTESYRFYRLSGNDDTQAKLNANADMRKYYGPTSLMGPNARELTAFPPEAVLPKIDGGHQWVVDQTLAHVNATLAANGWPVTLDKSRVRLIGTADTGRTITAKQPVYYDVAYELRDNGVWDVLPGGITLDPGLVTARRSVEASPAAAAVVAPPASPPSAETPTAPAPVLSVAAARKAARTPAPPVTPEVVTDPAYKRNRVFNSP